MTAVEFDAEHARDYLRAMYGQQNGQGYIQVCGTGNWAGKVFATDDIDNAVDYAMHRDKILDRRKPGGVYVRCTTLKAPPAPGDRGGADDTLAVPYFWSDIDFGTDGHKGGDDLPPTAEDAQPLVAEAGLPEPTTWVHSGGGWYALWVPSWEIDPHEAARISVNIQLWLEYASQKHGWKYGTGVSDLARVIRLPGSVNRKLPLNPRPCRVVGGTGKLVHRDALPTTRPEKPQTAKPTVGADLPPRRTDYTPSGKEGVFDALDQATWAEILEPHGWTYVKADSKGDLWLRPDGADSEYSARVLHVNPHVLVVHSTAAGLPVGEGRRLTKARVWAHLNGYGHDLSAAAKDLIAAARGEECTEAAASLPEPVLTAIRETCPTEAEVWARLGIDISKWEIHGQNGQNPTEEPAGTGCGHIGHGSGGSEIAASDGELESWLISFTSNNHPERLERRLDWMISDPPTRLAHHAVHMVAEAIAGDYPADAAAQVLDAVCRHLGQAEGHAAHLLSLALGSLLSSRGAAAR